MPEGPAVARGRVLDLGAHAVDRTGILAHGQAAIGAHDGLPAALLVGQHGARRQPARFHQRAERHLGRSALALHGLERAFVERQGQLDALVGDLDIAVLALAADPVTAKALGNRAGGAGAEERVEHHVALVGRGQHDAIEQRFRLLRRVGLGAVALEALLPRTDRQHPVRAHLQLVVQGLHRAIVEGVPGLLALGGPDQRFMGIGEARTLEVGHRVRLAPDDVVEDPEAHVLKHRAQAENVVIAADHPDRAIGLEQAIGLAQPFAGEAVVDGEAVELVPGIGHGVDMAAIGTREVATQLQVVGRIGEDHVDRGRGKRTHHLDAVALQDLVDGQAVYGGKIMDGGQDRRARLDRRLGLQGALARFHCRNHHRSFLSASRLNLNHRDSQVKPRLVLTPRVAAYGQGNGRGPKPYLESVTQRMTQDVVCKVVGNLFSGLASRVAQGFATLRRATDQVWNSTSCATGAKLRRWSGVGPWARRAARCCAVP